MQNNGPAAVCTVICSSIHLYCGWLSASAAGDSHHGCRACSVFVELFHFSKKKKKCNLYLFHFLEKKNPHTVWEISPFVNSKRAMTGSPGGATFSWHSFFSGPLQTCGSYNKASIKHLPATMAAIVSSSAAAASQDGKGAIHNSD